MADIYPIKAGFSSGILSLGATGRVDTQRYANGLAVCKNWLVTPQSALRLRRGAKYMESLSADAVDIRLISFPVNTGSDIVVVLDGTNITLHNRAGIVKGAGLFLEDPYFSSGEQFWKKVGHSSYFAEWRFQAGYRCLLQQSNIDFNNSPSLTANIGIQQKVTAPADTYKLRFGYASEAGRATNEQNENVFDYAACDGEVLIGTTAGGSQIASLPVKKADWANPTSYELTFTTTGVPFYITMRILAPFASGYGTGAFYAPALLSGSVVTPQSFVSPWDGSQIRSVQTAVDISSGEMFFVHPQVAPYKLTYDYLTRAWSFAIVAFTSPPSEWGANNWPSVVEIFQQRLWLAATPIQANTIWASKTGGYADFTIGANPSDAIEISLASAGTVLWMRGMSQLLLGTADGEFILGSESGAITGANFYIFRQNGYSSSAVQALFTGKQLVYISAGRRKVRVTEPSEEARGMTGTDISLVAADLFVSQIKEIHYAVEPEYLMYVVLEDGTIASCTYDSQSDLLAWHTFETPDLPVNSTGTIASICITQEAAGQMVWMAVRRAGTFTLEAIEPEFFTRRFLDSYEFKQIETIQKRAGAYSIAYSSAFSGGYVAAETTRAITGLERFEGVVVGIVFENTRTVNGNIEYEYLGEQMVAGGRVFVPNELMGYCAVGLPYKARAVTLPQEGGNPAGTSQGTKRKWNRIFARIGLSALPLLNGYRPVTPADKVPSSGNPLDAVLSGDFEVRNEGYDNGVVVIEQNLPLRTEIAGIFGKSQSSAV